MITRVVLRQMTSLAENCYQHLIDQGCSQIAYVTVDLNLNIYKNRFKGYKKALEANNIDFNSDLVFQANSDVISGRKVARQILSNDIKIDSIFCSSDYIALELYRNEDNNVDIPGDISVVGFSNEPFTELLDLTLTSIEQNPYEIGKSVLVFSLIKSMQKMRLLSTRLS